MTRRRLARVTLFAIPLLTVSWELAAAQVQLQASRVTTPTAASPNAISPAQLTRTVAGPSGAVTVKAIASGQAHSSQSVGSNRSAPQGLGTFIPLGVGVEGDQPEDVVLALNGTVAVVALRDTDSLEFYDVGTGARLGDVALPDAPIDLDVTPDGTQVFAACYGADQIAVVDVASRAVLRSLAVANQPHQMAILSDGVRVLVGCNATAGGGLLQLLHSQTGQVLAQSASPSQRRVSETISPWVGIRRPIFPTFAVSPDDLTLVIPSFDTGAVFLYDVPTLTQRAAVTGLPIRPFKAVMSPTGTFAAISAFSFSGAPNRILLIDTASGVTTEAAVGIEMFLSDIAITPNGQDLLVGTPDGLVKVNVASGQIVDTEPAVGGIVGDIAITASGTHALVGRAGYAVVEIATLDVVANFPRDLFPVIAVHPTAPLAVAVYPATNELIECTTTSGASSSSVWSTQLGEPVEVDAPYEIELTADETRAVLTCPLSENLAVIDVDTGSTLSVIPLGGASHRLDVSDTADVAMVGIDGTDEVAFVDLVTSQVVSRFAMGTNPRQLGITPDGTRAVVRLQDAADNVLEFFDLSGAVATSTGRIVAPLAGWHDMEMSPDGSLIAALGFDRVRFFDVAAQIEVASVTVTPFPQFGFWSDDSTRFGWSTNIFDTQVATLGGGAPTVATYSSSQLSLGGAFDASGTYLYQLVGALDVRVLDLASGALVAHVVLPGTSGGGTSYYPRWMERIGDQLLVTRTDFNASVYRLSMSGPTTALEETVLFETEGSYGMAYAHGTGRLFVPASTDGDGVRAVTYGGSWSTFCGPAADNSTGGPATVAARGPMLAGTQPIELSATSVPPFTFGMFIVSRTPGSVTPPGSQGTLCLGGSIGRLLGSVQSSGPLGRFAHPAVPATLPLPGGPAMPGEFLHFQAWFRDTNPTATSNLTDGVRVQLR